MKSIIERSYLSKQNIQVINNKEADEIRKKAEIPKLEDIDWLGEMPKSEFDREMAMFKHEMLVEQGRLSPYQEVVDGMKKEFSPTDEDLSANVFDFEDDES